MGNTSLQNVATFTYLRTTVQNRNAFLGITATIVGSRFYHPVLYKSL